MALNGPKLQCFYILTLHRFRTASCRIYNVDRFSGPAPLKLSVFQQPGGVMVKRTV